MSLLLSYRIAHEPMPRRFYAILPVVSTVLGGAGAALGAHAAGLPVVDMAGAGACVACLTGLWVAIDRIGGERAAYFQWKAEMERNKRVPDPVIEEEPEPEAEPVRSPDGYAPILRNAFGQIMAQTAQVFIREDDGSTTIYGLTVTRDQLKRLVEVARQPKAGLTYDDFVRPPNKVFSQGGLKHFQQLLVEQNYAVRTVGNRVYLTERGKRAALMIWARRKDTPPPSKTPRGVL